MPSKEANLRNLDKARKVRKATGDAKALAKARELLAKHQEDLKKVEEKKPEPETEESDEDSDDEVIPIGFIGKEQDRTTALEKKIEMLMEKINKLEQKKEVSPQPPAPSTSSEQPPISVNVYTTPPAEKKDTTTKSFLKF